MKLHGVTRSIIHVRGSVIPLVLRNPAPYVLTVLNAATMFSVKFGYFEPEKYHVQIHPHHSAMLTALMTFFLVFYNGHVFKRYNRIHCLMMDMSELCLELASMIARSMPSRESALKLVRMLLASTFMFYFGITPDFSDGAMGSISEAEWATMNRLNLLTTSEVQSLHAHCADPHATSGFASFIVLHWSLRLIYKEVDQHRHQEFERRYTALRRTQAEVLGLLELPMPMEYVHLVNMILIVTLTLLSYSMGLAESYTSMIIFCVVQLVFFGIRELTFALSDPFGIDEVDFPISSWMTSVYNMCISIINDDLDVPSTKDMQDTLCKIGLGRSVADILVDVHLHEVQKIRHNLMYRLSNGYSGVSMQQPSIGADYQSLPTEDTSGI